MGLDIELKKRLIDGIDEEIPIRSKKYPEHSISKLGYIVSSYNEVGINNVFQETMGIDLFDIFGGGRYEQEVFPDWESVKSKTILYKRVITNSLVSVGDGYRPVIIKPVNWYQQALEIIIGMCDFVLSQPDKEKYFLSFGH